MNVNAKCRKWDGLGYLGSFKIAPFDKAHMHSYEPSIATMSLSRSVSET